MKRGDLYRVHKGVKRDPKKYQVFVVVSSKILIESKNLRIQWLITDNAGTVKCNYLTFSKKFVTFIKYYGLIY